ncbi:MAG TPA: ABC transporter ATP-binding protein [Candidatus Saccharimonadales bacterium]|jgi:iron complex transport system ATP-binding protein|nr:ABC transporter ATP-binding protein [Candidatus Saccharimonadales bacterium]
MTSLLSVRNLSFGYAALGHTRRPVLDQLTFEVAQGATVALMGANGAGKTTLLKVFAGLLVPQRGEVRLLGRLLSACSRRELARSIALVPQEISVSVDFTVLQFVRQGRAPYLSFLGILQDTDRIAVWKALELAGVDHLAERRFNELSGGERQRVKIALALAQEPQLLLLDEPAQHLDIGRQAEIFSVLERLNQQGITIVAAVHDLESARRYFTQGILLRPGLSPIIGPPPEILTSSAIQEAFELVATEAHHGGTESLRKTKALKHSAT